MGIEFCGSKLCLTFQPIRKKKGMLRVYLGIFCLILALTWLNFSVYLRHCANRDIADKYIRNIEKQIPTSGKVALLVFTDKQYENMRVFYGKKRQKPSKKHLEYEFF